jgi:drug/metabolite transporter (DMT)-like permease
MPIKVKTTVFPLLAAFIWGVAFSAQKGNETGALTFNACRGIVAFVFLLVVVLVFTKGDWRHLLCESSPKETRTLWIGGICCGLALAFATFLQQVGLDGNTEAGKASFLTAMYIVLVPILGIPLKRRASLNVWVSVAVAVVGLYMLCVKEETEIRPDDLIVLSCSLVFAIHILLIDHFSPKTNGIKLSCIQFLTVFVVSGVLAFAFEQPSWEGIQASLLPIVYLGVMSSGVAYTLQIVAQRDADPTTLTVLLSMESVFGVIAGAFVLGEVLSSREYVGCILMFVAVILAQIPFDKLRKKEKAN